jgi:hypothetical protein
MAITVQREQARLQEEAARVAAREAAARERSLLGARAAEAGVGLTRLPELHHWVPAPLKSLEQLQQQYKHELAAAAAAAAGGEAGGGEDDDDVVIISSDEGDEAGSDQQQYEVSSTGCVRDAHIGVQGLLAGGGVFCMPLLRFCWIGRQASRSSPLMCVA